MFYAFLLTIPSVCWTKWLAYFFQLNLLFSLCIFLNVYWGFLFFDGNIFIRLHVGIFSPLLFRESRLSFGTCLDVCLQYEPLPRYHFFFFINSYSRVDFLVGIFFLLPGCVSVHLRLIRHFLSLG